MSANFSIESFAASHPGRVRPTNEDRFLERPDAGLWLAADGVGGLSHGDLASSMIADCARKPHFHGDHQARLQQLGGVFGEAHAAIQALAREHGIRRMASTVVALLTTESFFSVAWCGDSRAYLLRSGEIRQLTTDHTEVQDLLDRKLISQEQAAAWPRRNAVLHVIGVNERPVVEMMGGVMSPNDCFLLCTDGLSNYLTQNDICGLIGDKSAETACRDLIHCSLERGGADNITAVIVRFHIENALQKPN